MSSTLTPLVKSKMKVRAAAKGLSAAEIEKLIANLQAVLKSAEEKEKAKSEASKKAKIAKIKALMEESGLQPADLKVSGRGRKRKGPAMKRKKAAPKYRLVVGGVEHLWSGRGRPPKVFKAYMDSGKSKETCAI
ncbi:MAG: H-NS family nucleoid-associated regulatory protein [Congregibacter sp.]